MTEEIIYAKIDDPMRRGMVSKKSDKAKLHLISCSNKDACDLYKKGTCHYRSYNVKRKCPYGERKLLIGYTQRAKKYSSWVLKKQEEYKEELKSDIGRPAKKLARVGEYIYLPYSFLHTYINSMTDELFLPRKEFNENFLNNLLEYIPRSLSGTEIKEFRREILPKIIKHIQEDFPELFKLISKREKVKEILSQFTVIGRKALVSTLKVGARVKNKWVWDGNYLVNSRFDVLVSPVKYEKAECKIKPKEGEVIEITSKNQVTEETEFIE